MSIKDKLIIYVYNKKTELEQEKQQLNYQIRYQPMDSLELYENMRSQVYIEAFNNFLTDIFNIIINCK